MFGYPFFNLIETMFNDSTQLLNCTRVRRNDAAMKNHCLDKTILLLLNKFIP